jgi:transglutaminase-like putative cysteine protease
MAISVVTTSGPGNASGVPLPEVFAFSESFPPPVAVNRTTLRIIQMTDYHYAVPAKQVVTFLKLLPPAVRGWQTRLQHQLQAAPLPHTILQQVDTLGNEFWDVRHERVQSHLTFAVQLQVRTHCAYSEEGISLPTPIAANATESLALLRTPTNRTQPDAHLKSVAETVCYELEDRRPSLRLFGALCARVHQEMHFDSKATQIQTTAAESWQLRRGVCQDYSHITLTLCRLCGIPARYVSGFVPGEGVMHAWVEAWLPVRIQGKTRDFWFAYDPTYNKWVDDNYVTVATGRDYADITPTSGTYFGGQSVVKYRNTVTITNKQIHLL